MFTVLLGTTPVTFSIFEDRGTIRCQVSVAGHEVTRFQMLSDDTDAPDCAIGDFDCTQAQRSELNWQLHGAFATFVRTEAWLNTVHEAGLPD